VSTLIERGHLERQPRARRPHLEDQRDLLAIEPLHLAPRYVATFTASDSCNKNHSSRGSKSISFRQTAIAQIEHQALLML
jgi:hypothetical protein